MKKLWVILSTMLMLSILSPVVYGQQHIVMDVKAGYEGVLISGGVAPVEVTLKSNEDMTGKLRISYEDHDEGTIVASEVAINLVKGNETRYELPLMVEQEIYSYQKDKFLYVELLNTSDMVISEKYFGINEIISYGDLVTGVLSDRYTNLTYLNLIDVVSDSGSVIDMNTAKMSAWQLDDEKYLKGIDLLIVDAFEEKLTDQQVETLKSWVAKGGLLVIASGDAYISQEMLLNEFDVAITSSLFTDDSFELEDINQVALEAATYEKSVNHQGLYAKTYGSGKVVALTYGLGDMKLVKNKYASNYIETVIQDELVDSLKAYVMPDDYRRLNNVLNRVPKESMPSIKSIIMIVLLYLMCAGPVSYVILKKRGQRNYYWHTLGALAVLATMVVFVAGNGIDFNKRLANGVTIIDQRGMSSHVTTLLGVKDSGVGDVDIAPESGHITWSGSYDYEVAPRERLYYYDDAEHVIFKGVKKFQFVNLMIENEMNLAEKSQEVIFDERGAVIRIDNPFDYPLVDVAILMNEHIYWVDRIEAGQTKDVNMAVNGTSNWDTYDFYDYDYNYSNGLSNDDIDARYYKNRVISAFFDASHNGRLSEDMSPMVFGWLDESLAQNISVNGHQTELSGMSLWVDQVTIGRPESGDVELPMGILVPQTIMSGEVYYDEYDRSYYGYGDIQFTFTLPEWLDGNSMTVNLDDRYELDYKIYNPKSQLWEALDAGGGGDVAVSMTYLSEDQELWLSVANNSGDMFYGPQLSVKGVVLND